MVVFFGLTACFPEWRDQMLRDMAENRVHRSFIDLSGISSNSLSQTVEFYDPSGSHIGYGKTQGGSIEFFNNESNRTGFGRR